MSVLVFLIIVLYSSIILFAEKFIYTFIWLCMMIKYVFKIENILVKQSSIVENIKCLVKKVLR